MAVMAPRKKSLPPRTSMNHLSSAVSMESFLSLKLHGLELGRDLVEVHQHVPMVSGSEQLTLTSEENQREGVRSMASRTAARRESSLPFPWHSRSPWPVLGFRAPALSCLLGRHGRGGARREGERWAGVSGRGGGWTRKEEGAVAVTVRTGASLGREGEDGGHRR